MTPADLITTLVERASWEPVSLSDPCDDALTGFTVVRAIGRLVSYGKAFDLSGTCAVELWRLPDGLREQVLEAAEEHARRDAVRIALGFRAI